MTLEAWIKATDLPAKDKYYSIAGEGFLQTATGFGLYIPSSGNLTFQTRNGQSSSSATYNFTPDGEWHHVVGVRDSAEQVVVLYVDGIEVGRRENSTIDFTTVDRRFTIGTREGAVGKYGFGFKGELSEVRLWNNARTASEIRELSRQRLRGSESGLIGYWPLNEGTGTRANDLVAAGNGTIASGTWVDSEMDYRELAVVNPVTRSSHFVAGDEVEVTQLPQPAGYSHYQITV